MPLVSYRAPAADKKGKLVYLDKTGKVAWMQIGKRRVKCALQDNGPDTSPDLVHIASGQKIISGKTIAEIKLENFVCNRCALPDRHAAEIALARVLNAKGDEHVLSVFDAAPVVNADTRLIQDGVCRPARAKRSSRA